MHILCWHSACRFFYYIKSLILAGRAPSKISLEVLNAPREVTYYFYDGPRLPSPLQSPVAELVSYKPPLRGTWTLSRYY